MKKALSYQDCVYTIVIGKGLLLCSGIFGHDTMLNRGCRSDKLLPPLGGIHRSAGIYGIFFDFDLVITKFPPLVIFNIVYN